MATENRSLDDEGSGGWPRSDVVESTLSYSRRITDDPQQVRIQATVPPNIGSLGISIPSFVFTESARAERALVRLDGYARALTPDVIEAVTTALLRAESVSSSRIEGLDVSNRRLGEAFYDPAAAKRLAREVANNARALKHAIGLGRQQVPLAPEDICSIHEILMADVPGIVSGQLRTVQNWIGPTPDPADAEFVPPPAELVSDLLADLCGFMERDDLPPTIRAAIGHAQFEAIHPFPDGNGRVGRCLISVMLRRGAGTDIVPPISGVCVTETSRYFGSLHMFQQQANPWPWVSQFCQATEVAAKIGVRLSNEIVELQEQWVERAGRPRDGSITRQLIGLLPTMSFTDAGMVARTLAVDPNVARRGLNRLEAAGVLTPIAGRKRNRVWRVDELHELLDRYSAGFSRGDIQ